MTRPNHGARRKAQWNLPEVTEEARTINSADRAHPVGSTDSTGPHPTRTRPDGAPVVAYLVSRYPAVSHTFIRREIAELRRLGLRVETFSLRREAREALHFEEDLREQDATFHVLPASAFATLRALLETFDRHPLRSPRNPSGTRSSGR